MLEVELHGVITDPVAFDSRLALLVGLERAPYGGVGSAWGTMPVSLEGKQGLRLLTVATVPAVPAKVPFTLRLRFDDVQGGVTIRSALSAGGQPVGDPLTATAKGADARGYLGLYLERTEVYITRLEVRGAVDPGIVR